MSLLLSANTSADGKRRYRALFKGQAVCADKMSLQEAWDAAKSFFPEVEAQQVQLWDGDLGRYTSWEV